ncbi:MAG: TonB-dependent receptor, partial [Lewinella sp.]|nr:TonB-dependent receptor [Lewinella sp.]
MRLVVFVFLALTGHWLHAQETTPAEQLLSVRFDATPLPAAIREVAAALNHPIYFRAADLPDRPITTVFEQQPAGDILARLLEGSGLEAVPYRQSALYLISNEEATRDRAYLDDFFAALNQRLAAGESPEAIIRIGADEPRPADQQATIQGLLTDADTGEPLVGATVFWPAANEGTVSDPRGTWQVQVPPGAYELQINYIGYRPFVRQVEVLGDGFLDIRLSQEATNLEMVIVLAEAPDDNVVAPQVGVTSLSVRQLEELPTLLGESDVVRGLLIAPGVSSIGEGAAGFNVRGGQVDQNLILQGESIVFNASHALGFYSTFNPLAIASVDLYKSILPARYGGRLSSVLDIGLRDGHRERWQVKGGIGPITGRLGVEGPLPGKRGSVLATVRGAYSDWILRQVNILEVQQSQAHFFDANLRLAYDLSEQDKLHFSGYWATDEFVYNDQFGFDYTTLSGELGYRRILNDLLSAEFSLVGSQYRSQQTNLTGELAGELANGLDYYKVKGAVFYQPDDSWQWEGGLEVIFYRQQGQGQTPLNSASSLPARTLDDEHAREAGLYLQTSWEVNDALTLIGGLRTNLYQYTGREQLLAYADPDRPDLTEVI